MRAAGLSDVDDSHRRRAEYASDASLYRVPPAVVVFPRDVDEVATMLDVCRGLGVPLTSRGGGTSVAGNAVGPGVVADFSRHMGGILDIDVAGRRAKVQPGVVLSDLQSAVRPNGLRFGPDPSTANRCTIGGMIGNNACGARSLAYGRTVDNVEGLDFLTGRGESLELRADESFSGAKSVEGALAVGLRYHQAIERELDRFPRQISGYPLHHLLPGAGRVGLRSLVGTEGTCGIVTEATLRLVEIPQETLLLVFGFESLAAAADHVPTLAAHRPAAIEALDRRIVDVVKARRVNTLSLSELPRGAAWLLVEVSGHSIDEVRELAGAMARAAGDATSTLVTDPQIERDLWEVREAGVGLTSRSEKGEPAYAGWEDAAVPPANLGSYLREFDSLMNEHGLTGMPYGHFGDGCVHVRLDFPLGSAGGSNQLRTFLMEAADLVATYGGSMSGEHGDGRARSELLPKMYSGNILQAFSEFKAAFDPDNILNPGIIVDPYPVDTHLRLPPRANPDTHLQYSYPDDRFGFASAVHRCVGVGKCRANQLDSPEVMCPSFVATGDEKDSTRGRARVLQEMVTGEVITDGWRSKEVAESLDLCLSCKGCRTDCPTGVDMAKYKAEVLHQSYRGRLRPRSHYTLGWLPRWTRVGPRTRRVVNWVLGAKYAGKVARYVGGIDARRSLPRLAETTLREWFVEREPPRDRGGRPVVLWVDTFTNAFNPAVGRAAIRVLEDAGFLVQLSPESLCCALTLVSTGQLTSARRVMERTVAALAPHARAGTPIVAIEPSCAAALRSDLVELLGESEASRSVSNATKTLAEVLSSRRPDWTPPRLEGTQILAQPHCHHRAVMGWATDRGLIAATGASIVEVPGCCGMAGNFGVERGHYELSIAVAENALLPGLREIEPTAIALVDGFSCQTQIRELSGHRTVLHLAEVLEMGIDARLSREGSSDEDRGIGRMTPDKQPKAAGGPTPRGLAIEQRGDALGTASSPHEANDD